MISDERQLVERHEGWNKWCSQIPKLHFKEDWEVRVIPPFMGALTRFTVSKGDRSVSVYLDVNGSLAPIEEPYFEIYDGTDIMRFLMNDEDAKEMMETIRKVLDDNYYLNERFEDVTDESED